MWGYVKGEFFTGTTQYNWQALPYKTETNYGTTTNTISWETVNPYGNDVQLDLVSDPASEILVHETGVTVWQIGTCI